MFCAYHNAGLWAFCSAQEPPPTKVVYSSLAQNFAWGRGASWELRGVRLLGNLACSLSGLSLTIPCWISTFPAHAAGSWVIKSSFNLTCKAGPGGEGAGLHLFLALRMQRLPVRDVGAPCEVIPAWILCLLCLFLRVLLCFGYGFFFIISNQLGKVPARTGFFRQGSLKTFLSPRHCYF